MTPTLKAHVQATEFLVSCLPPGHEDRDAFGITVQWRSADRWAVTRLSRCLSVDGEWHHEHIPSERAEAWLAAHRFDLRTALRLAKKAAPHVTVPGWTVADVLASEDNSP